MPALCEMPMGALCVVLGSLSMVERGLAQQQGGAQLAQQGRVQQVSLVEMKPRPALTVAQGIIPPPPLQQTTSARPVQQGSMPLSLAHKAAVTAQLGAMALTQAQSQMSLARSALQASTRMQWPRPHALPVLMGPSCQWLHLIEQHALAVCHHLLGLAAPVAQVRATSTAQGGST